MGKNSVFLKKKHAVSMVRFVWEPILFSEFQTLRIMVSRYRIRNMELIMY